MEGCGLTNAINGSTRSEIADSAGVGGGARRSGRVGSATRTCVDQDVSLQVVATPEGPVTVITDEVLLHFGRRAVLVSTWALRRPA